MNAEQMPPTAGVTPITNYRIAEQLVRLTRAGQETAKAIVLFGLDDDWIGRHTVMHFRDAGYLNVPEVLDGIAAREFLRSELGSNLVIATFGTAFAKIAGEMWVAISDRLHDEFGVTLVEWAHYWTDESGVESVQMFREHIYPEIDSLWPDDKAPWLPARGPDD